MDNGNISMDNVNEEANDAPSNSNILINNIMPDDKTTDTLFVMDDKLNKVDDENRTNFDNSSFSLTNSVVDATLQPMTFGLANTATINDDESNPKMIHQKVEDKDGESTNSLSSSSKSITEESQTVNASASNTSSTIAGSSTEGNANTQPTTIITGDTRRRVKLYMLNANRTWDDRGTGHVSSSYVERLKGVSLLVKAETDGSLLLESKILADTAYQKQQDTLIVWSEGENYDLALSFQERVGCEEIWAKICQVQGKDPSLDITQDVGDDDDSGKG